MNKVPRHFLKHVRTYNAQSFWNMYLKGNVPTRKKMGAAHEMHAVVVRHGKMDKTITVRVLHRFWYNKLERFMYRSKKYQVHDEENFCKAGDHVIVKTMPRISKLKAFYVSRLTKQGARFDFWEREDMEKRETLKTEVKKQLEVLRETDLKGIYIKNAAHLHELKKKLKRKAMHKAILELRKLDAQETE